MKSDIQCKNHQHKFYCGEILHAFLRSYFPFLYIYQLASKMRRFEENPINLNTNSHLIPNTNKPTRLNPLYQSCKVMTFTQNQGFCMGEEIKSDFESEESVKEEEPAPKEKKVNLVKAALLMSTKRSISNPKNKNTLQIPKREEERETIVKSENSFSLHDSVDSINRDQNEDAPQEKLSINAPEEDADVYYIKKVRVLENKFKKYKLDSETEIMKLKNQNKQLKAEINLHKQFIQKSQNNLQEKFSQFKEKLIESSMNDSDSSSSADGEKVMPMVSQIMEVKLQGLKLCEKIKALQRNIKLEKSINLKMKQDIQKLNEERFPKNKLNPALRKWSIQAFSPKMKKQSFQISKISTDAKQTPTHSNAFKKISADKKQKPQTSKPCKRCEQLKGHILKLNRSIKSIPLS